MADGALRCARGQPRFADNPDVKLLLEFWSYGLRQAGANWVDLIAARGGERHGHLASVE